MGRVILYLVKYWLKNYPITCEIWSYESNKQHTKELLGDLLEDAICSDRIKLITEETFNEVKRSRWAYFKEGLGLAGKILIYGSHVNWKQPYRIYCMHYGNIFCWGMGASTIEGSWISRLNYMPVDISFSIVLILAGFVTRGIRRVVLKNKIIMKERKTQDQLAVLANRYSQADCMVIPIVTLKSGLDLDFPRLVILLDLVTLEYYDYFIGIDPNLIYWIDDGRKCAEEYGRQGIFFCGISNYVIIKQLLKYINTVRKENTGYIYLAAMIPDGISKKLLSRRTIQNKYKIEGRYIFYPTQIRPYKNIITLLKAVQLLRLNNIDIKVVLTAEYGFKYDPKACEYSDNNGLWNRIIFCKSVPELDLYSLYAHAEAITVTSLFEGGFPLQALEALMMDTPVIMAKIPVTLERLAHEGLAQESCGLLLYSPEDENGLAEGIRAILRDRGKVVQNQERAKRKLLSYTWDDVSREYYERLSKVVGNSNRSQNV